MTQSLLNGVEAIFIPIKDPQLSSKWYEDKLGFKLLYIEEEAAVMKIADQSATVVCLVKAKKHQPLHFQIIILGLENTLIFFRQILKRPINF